MAAQQYTGTHQNINRPTKKTENLEVYADLTGCMINGATIPQDILTVSGVGSNPDLVLIDRREKMITVMELTSPLESNIDVVPFEIGSRFFCQEGTRIT